jgi:tRNA threonylcarbamoyl adenosine modification protein YeaZ
MKILAFDTSNIAMSVAVVEDSTVLGEIFLNKKKNHSISLMPEIDHLMKSLDVEANTLDRIVVSVGPGSYTGIRIAVTTAKMLAYSLGIELVGVSTLETLARNREGFDGLVIPMIDARRKNIYTAVFDGVQKVENDHHISLELLLEKLENTSRPLLFLGDALNFSDEILLKFPQAMIEKDEFFNIPHGSILAKIGLEKAAVSSIDDFVPNYLKRVEAEEVWLSKQGAPSRKEDYVEKI